MPTWTHLQSNEVSNANGVVAFGSNVTSGSLIFAVAMGDTTAGSSVPTDTRGNTYTKIREDVDANGERISTYFTVNGSSGANTVTIPDHGGFDDYMISEWSVDASPIATDGANANTASWNTGTDAVTTGAVVTTQNGDLILCVACSSNGVSRTLTAGTGFTQRLSSTLLADPDPTMLESATQATAGSITGTFTVSSAGQGLTSIAAFKAGTGAAATLTSLPILGVG